ncbi:MAG: hypothetical protein ABR998_15320 [Gemmatimonadales bacterium]
MHEETVFTASRAWTFNVRAAILVGIGGAGVMGVVATILLVSAASPNGRLFGAAWLLGLVVVLLLGFVGNGFAAYPFEVVVHQGVGLRLRVPFRELSISVQDLRDVQVDALGGYVVRLTRRQRLLGSFFIHRMFGEEGGPLAAAIRGEIEARGGRPPVGAAA